MESQDYLLQAYSYLSQLSRREKLIQEVKSSYCRLTIELGVFSVSDKWIVLKVSYDLDLPVLPLKGGPSTELMVISGIILSNTWLLNLN